MKRARSAHGIGPRSRRLGLVTLTAVAALVVAPLPAAVAGFDDTVVVSPGIDPSRFVVADFNGDGINDLAGSDRNTNNVYLYRGLGNRQFAAPVAFPAGAPTENIATADMNGDGRPDLVVSSPDPSSSTVTVLLNNGTGGFGAPTTYAGNAFPAVLDVVDLNGDGRPDVFTADDGGTMSVALNQGNGTLAPPTLMDSNASAATSAVADFNGDGAPDIALGEIGGTAVIELNDGHGNFPTSTVVGTGSSDAIASGDLNGDGTPDLAIADGSNATLSLFFNDGHGHFAAGPVRTTPQGPTELAIADLNGDGHQDVVLTSSDADQVSTYLNDGTGTLKRNWAGSFPGDASRFTLARLDGDTYPDLVASSGQQFGVRIEYGNTASADPDVPTLTMTVDPSDHTVPGPYYSIASSGTDGVLVHVAATEYGEIQRVSCTDTIGSGPATTVLDTTTSTGSVILGDGQHQLACTATNGTHSSLNDPLTAIVDQTAPTVSGTVSPNPVVVGSPATATASATDAVSGVATKSCQQPDTSTVGNKVLTCQATDHAGNPATVQVAYSVVPVPDTTPPVVTVTVDPSDAVSATGWYNTASSGTDGVLVHVSATDDHAVTNVHCNDGAAPALDTSGAPGTITLNDGVHNLSCTASDGVNSSTPVTLVAKVDQTAPSIGGSVTPNPVFQGQSATATPSAADTTSGIGQSVCGQPDTSVVGAFSVTCSASDVAGNSASTSVGYTVQAVPITPVTISVGGSKVYGSSTSAFTASGAVPSGVTLNGTPSCTQVSTGATINGALGAGSYTVDPATCTGLSLSGAQTAHYRLVLAGGPFTVTKAAVTVTTSSTSSLMSLFTRKLTYTSTVTSAVTGLPVPGVPVTTQLANGAAASRCTAVTNTHGVATCTASSVFAAPNAAFTAAVAEGPNTKAGSATGKVKPF